MGTMEQFFPSAHLCKIRAHSLDLDLSTSWDQEQEKVEAYGAAHDQGV